MINFEENIKKNFWFDYSAFYKLMAEKEGINIVAEIGSWKGHSTSFLAKKMIENKKTFRIYAVDIWEKWTEVDEWVLDKSEVMEEIPLSYEMFNLNLINNGVREFITDVKELSTKAYANFKDEYFDLVFLDANHKYESVKEDIELWYPKVRIGGIMAGHDYFQDECGVSKAVDGFFENDISTNGAVWFHTKK